MIKMILAFLAMACLAGCANGPTHDYYNPDLDANINHRFSGPVRIERVDDLEQAKAKFLLKGGEVIGASNYNGKFPELSELRAQARRSHANYVIYTCDYIPPQPGSWHFSMNSWGAAGGTDGGGYVVHILFLGR